VQKISFGNREYVKASQAAKRFKYTQDYVGQLCRTKKVDARLVGRVWYVNLESITQYRTTKHATQKKAAKDTTAAKSKTTKSAVESVVRAKTARKLQETFPKEAKQAVMHMSATYSRDKTSIIPVLGSRDVIQSSEEATPKEKRSIIIKVRPNTKKITTYVTEKTPEITLKSTLKVTDKFENFVPDTPHSQLNAQFVEASVDDVRSVSSPSLHPSVKNTPINFHPSSVATQKTAPSRTQNSTKQIRRKPIIRLLAVGGYFLIVILAVVLILGSAYFNETGTPVPTSGVAFSVDVAIEKVLESVQ
jgi:hypothetical protein